MFDGNFPPYVSVAERQRRAQREAAKLRRQGRKLAPVSVEGRGLASTVWGKAWCLNLEAYSDFASRLPRGRSYLKNGLVLDLEIRPGRVKALVSGTDLYQVEVKVKPLPEARWRKLVKACAGQVASVVELLQGRLSQPVMEVLCRKGEGLFPTPAEISLSCTCPDFASLCKHVAAALYGVGVRLDTAPELLFTLRQVDGAQLVTGAAAGLAEEARTTAPLLEAGDELGSLFDIDLAPRSAGRPASSPDKPRRAGRRHAAKAIASRRPVASSARKGRTQGSRRREKVSAPLADEQDGSVLTEVLELLTRMGARLSPKPTGLARGPRASRAR
jgi:uncharacterized Zn finger protein